MLDEFRKLVELLIADWHSSGGTLNANGALGPQHVELVVATDQPTEAADPVAVRMRGDEGARFHERRSRHFRVSDRKTQGIEDLSVAETKYEMTELEGRSIVQKLCLRDVEPPLAVEEGAAAVEPAVGRDRGATDHFAITVELRQTREFRV